MTDFYAKYCFVLAHTLTVEEGLWLYRAVEIGEKRAEKKGHEFPSVSIGSAVAIVSGDDFGGHIVEYVQMFLRRHRPDSVVMVEVAHTSSPPCREGFGGSVFLISAEKVYGMNTSSWGNQVLDAMRNYSDLDPVFLPPVSHQEHAAMMAALRTYQHEVDCIDEPLHVSDIATDMGLVDALGGTELQMLIDKMNGA